MSKQSGYLQRWENETNRLLQATMVITSQYDIDTLQIAIHQSEGWGYDRIMRLTEAWAEVRKEYRPALDYKNPAADVCQEHMAETLVNFVVLLVVVGFAVYEASSGNIAMTVYACTLLALFSLLWKMESIERHLKRLCELLEGEGDDGEE